MNDGQCIDGINDFTCKCKAGWTGVLCNKNINECENHSCQHSSICKDAIVNYTCECKPGYGGRFCEINIDDCNPNPCQNRGLLEKVFYLCQLTLFLLHLHFHFLL